MSQEQSSVRSEMDEDDWMDVMESEFVDFVEGTTTVGFVFDHPEIGLHGFKFDEVAARMEPCSFEVQNDQ